VLLVIADTGPINYLVLIGQAELLPKLFERIFLPAPVRRELADPDAPAEVRPWIANPPGWLDIRETDAAPALSAGLDQGEAAVIALAAALKADLLLIDDRAGVMAPRAKGFRVTGTLGVLDLAAERGLVDIADAIRQLEGTNFRRPAELLQLLLKKHCGG
jgi:predicted nucleic acid-binding protein